MSQMATHPMAKTYAKALFGAVQAEDRARTAEVLLGLAEVWPQVSDALLSPMVAAESKRKLWDSIQSQAGIQGFLKVLDAHRRLRLLPQVAAVFEQMTLDAEGRVKLRVQVAGTMSAETQERFQSYLSVWMGKPVAMETQVNAALLGGVRVISPDGLFDISLQGKMQALKNYLLKNT